MRAIGFTHASTPAAGLILHALFLFAALSVGLILQKRFKLTRLKVNRYLRKFLGSYFELTLSITASDTSIFQSSSKLISLFTF